MRAATAVLAIALWTAAWFVVAGFVVHDMRSVADLGDTVVSAGRALDSTADALEEFEDVPFVGGDLRRIRAQVRQAANEARTTGASTKRDVRRLAWLLGLAVALVPTVPVLVAYRVRR